jgi:hypothetical protein
VFVAATLSARGYYVVATTGWWATEWFPVLLVCAGVTFLGFTLRRAPEELRLLWLFGALVFAASLFSPVTNGDGTYWQRLAHPMWNMRYEYLLTLAWLTTLVWTLCASSQRMLRYPALLLLALICFVAIPRDWEDPPFVNYHYQSYAQRVEQAPAGSRIVIPLNPGGFGPGGWTMTLIKQ